MATYLPMSERLTDRNVSPRHVFNIAKRLATRNLLDFNGSIHDQYSNANWIRSNANPTLINILDAELKEEYKLNGGRAHKRGRPPGALNKGKPATDALADLSREDEADDVLREENLREDTPAPNGDMSAYVLKTEFNRQMGDIGRKLGETDLVVNGLSHTITDLSDRVNNIIDNRPTIIELKRPELPDISVGIQHKNFGLLLKICNAAMRSGNHLNIWIYGPKGSGKTTAAENVCKALFGSVERYYYNGALASAFQVTGFMDAMGKYVTTPFRQAWEHGGVYLFDEIDGSMPDALLALNGALANGIASFPDKMVPRHPDCIILAGANTTGLGGTVEYVGRFKQDAALTDRFVYLDWPHDDGLENALCANHDWVATVRRVRENCQRVKYKGQIPSMRASLYGEALLAAGLELEYVIDATIRKGVAANDWDTIKPGYY